MSHSKPHLLSKRKSRFLGSRKVALHNPEMDQWKRIREARKAANLTQQQVADACEISREAVAQWEASQPDKRTTPSLPNLQVFARLAKITIGDLFDDAQPASTARTTDSASTKETTSIAVQLLKRATPRSRKHLEAIIAAANAGRLTDADVALLGAIAKRFSKP